MNLIALNFWNVVVLLSGGLLLIGIYRLALWMAEMSLNAVSTLTYSGLRGVARFMLTIFIGYSWRTYQSNRMLYWNRVGFRFAMFWAGALLLALVLVILKLGNTIDSIGTIWIITMSIYLGFRALMYLTASPRQLGYASGTFVPNVNEQLGNNRWASHQIIRQWDFLDELFAQ
ncbi:hypothetical protein [Spirosoma aerophilum]